MRDCGACNLCCKYFEVKDTTKQYEWCEHCNISVGCKIHETKPKQCKDFDCMWRDERTPEVLYPLTCGFFIADEGDPASLTIYTEKHKIKNVVKYMKDIYFYNKEDKLKHYVVRYDSNPKHIGVYSQEINPNDVYIENDNI